MIEGNMSVCPICKGLDSELRGGLDSLFEKSSRRTYDSLFEKYSNQCGSTTLTINTLKVIVDNDGNLKLFFRARCAKCDTLWNEEIIVKPQTQQTESEYKEC